MRFNELAVNKIVELYEDLSKFVKSWKPATSGIILAVLASCAFFCFAKFLKANTGENAKVKNLGGLFLLLLFHFRF